MKSLLSKTALPENLRSASRDAEHGRINSQNLGERGALRKRWLPGKTEAR